MGVSLRVLWFFIDFAATGILLFASFTFLLDFVVGGYFAHKVGQGGDDFLFFYVYPGILSAIVFLWMLYELPSKLLLCISYYSLAEKLYRAELSLLKRLPGPKWFWTMGTMGRLGDVQSLQGKIDEANQTYFMVAEYSRQAGLFASMSVGSSLENYADQLAKGDRLLDYAEWKGRFRGANISRRIVTVLWLSLAVIAAQVAMRLTNDQIPTIASSLSYLGRYELADSLLRGALSRYGKDATPESVALLIQMADNNQRWGRLEEAELIYRKLLPIDDILAGKLDKTLESQPGMIVGLRDYASLKMRRGDFDIAEAAYGKIFKTTQRTYDRLALVDLLIEKGDLAAAKSELEDALAACKKMADRNAADKLRLNALSKLGAVNVRLGRIDEAQGNYTEMLTVARTLKPPSTDGTLTAMIGQMETHYMLRDRAAAKQFQDEAMNIASKPASNEQPLVSAARFHQIAESLKRLGEFAGADENYMRAMRIIKQSTSANNPALVGYLINRGDIALKQDKLSEADAFYSQAAQIASKSALGSGHPATLRLLVRQAELKMRQKDFDKAAQELIKALALIENQKLRRIPEDLLTSMKNCADQLKGTNKTSEQGYIQKVIASLDARYP
ncbi:MAG TPA: hypothetical protein V6D17_09085 [Candidatus Obscuribacterales bacterium]